MVNYEIKESEFWHISQLCGTLRYDDLAEITCFGMRPFATIKACYKTSHLRRSVFVEGQLAAMWGLAGVILSGRGEPWLLTSKAIEKIPVSFVREGREEINEMLTMCHRLEGITTEAYPRAHRFLRALGFTLSDPFLLKGVLVRKYTMEA